MKKKWVIKSRQVVDLLPIYRGSWGRFFIQSKPNATTQQKPIITVISGIDMELRQKCCCTVLTCWPRFLAVSNKSIVVVHKKYVVLFLPLNSFH